MAPDRRVADRPHWVVVGQDQRLDGVEDRFVVNWEPVAILLDRGRLTETEPNLPFLSEQHAEQCGSLRRVDACQYILKPWPAAGSP